MASTVTIAIAGSTMPAIELPVAEASKLYAELVSKKQAPIEQAPVAPVLADRARPIVAQPNRQVVAKPPPRQVVAPCIVPVAPTSWADSVDEEEEVMQLQTRIDDSVTQNGVAPKSAPPKSVPPKSVPPKSAAPKSFPPKSAPPKSLPPKKAAMNGAPDAWQEVVKPVKVKPAKRAGLPVCEHGSACDGDTAQMVAKFETGGKTCDKVHHSEKHSDAHVITDTRSCTFGARTGPLACPRSENCNRDHLTPGPFCYFRAGEPTWISVKSNQEYLESLNLGHLIEEHGAERLVNKVALGATESKWLEAAKAAAV